MAYDKDWLTWLQNTSAPRHACRQTQWSEGMSFWGMEQREVRGGEKKHISNSSPRAQVLIFTFLSAFQNVPCRNPPCISKNCHIIADRVVECNKNKQIIHFCGLCTKTIFDEFTYIFRQPDSELIAWTISFWFVDHRMSTWSSSWASSCVVQGILMSWTRAMNQLESLIPALIVGLFHPASVTPISPLSSPVPFWPVSTNTCWSAVSLPLCQILVVFWLFLPASCRSYLPLVTDPVYCLPQSPCLWNYNSTLTRNYKNSLSPAHPDFPTFALGPVSACSLVKVTYAFAATLICC